MSTERIAEGARRWLPFVQAFVQAYEEGVALTAGLEQGDTHAAGAPLASPGPGQTGAPLVLLCSPHPDDEVLTGALPLRLLQEQGARVINLALTLGSEAARQAARWAELLEACQLLGFGCQQFMAPAGFDVKAGVDGRGWDKGVERLAGLLDDLSPDFVFFPHGQDHHPAHVAVSHLVGVALARWTSLAQTAVKAVETEYWRPMAAPNLLVGLTSVDLARLLAALACHRGEIARNPYHLTQPARMLDAVRRGAELVASASSDRPAFLFGELYRLSVWQQGENRTLPLPSGWFGPQQGLLSIVGKES